MRILYIILCFCILGVASANAYIAERDIDKIDAGEHNTNLYKLNSQGAVIMKKLKKIDESIARREKYNKPVEDYSLEMILSSDEEDKARYELEKISASLDKNLENPRALKAPINPNIYLQLAEMSANSRRDDAVAAELKIKLRRKNQ